MNLPLLRGIRARYQHSIYTSFDRNVYILLSYSLGKGLQLAIGAITINLYAYSLGYRSDFIGVLAGMPALGSFLFAVPAGVLSDRFGRKPMILISAILTPITLIGTGLSTNPVVLLSFGFLNGVTASMYWITQLPLLTESTRVEQRVQALSINTFLLLGIGSFGSLVGGSIPEFVGHLLGMSANSTIPLRWGVLSAGIIVAITSIPLVFLREPPKDRQQVREISEQHRASESSGWSIVWLFVALLIPDVIFTTGESSVIGLLQLFFRLRYHLEPGTIGFLFTFIGVAGGTAALIAPRLAGRWGKLRTATTMQYLSIPVMLLTGFAPVALLATVGELFRAFFRGIFEPIYSAFVMEQVSSRWRATLSGFYGVTWGVGYSVGSSLAGFLQVHSGLSTPFIVGAVCLMVSPSLLLLRFSHVPATS